MAHPLGPDPRQMTAQRPPGRVLRAVATGLLVAFALCLAALPLRAAPYAALVMDARDGRVLYEKNADARLHPASLTKMMTLYIAFDAIERGEIDVDRKITISANAASEPPSRLGLRRGQKVSLRHLIRAAALRSANDAATAIGEAISGSEAAFAERMTRTARALGMNSTTFRNAHGLTASGHLSTARDMTVLGRRLIHDFPEYYTLFSRREESAGVARVANTNRRFLAAYRGADGIKTGFTNAAGYNLTASAKRGDKRIVATVFGGTSTPMRNAKMAELLDIGFKRAPAQVPVRVAPVALNGVVTGQAPSVSLRPRPRPADLTQPLVAAVSGTPEAAPDPAAIADALASATEAAIASAGAEPDTAPNTAPAGLIAAVPVPEPAPHLIAEGAEADESLIPAGPAIPRPRPRPGEIVMTAVPTGAPTAAANGAPDAAPTPETIAAVAAEVGDIVAQLSTSGARHWGVTLGKFRSQAAAERALLQTALAEPLALEGGLRRVATRPTGYEANFVGLGHDQADLVCRRLQARGTTCFVLGP